MRFCRRLKDRSRSHLSKGCKRKRTVYKHPGESRLTTEMPKRCFVDIEFKILNMCLKNKYSVYGFPSGEPIFGYWKCQDQDTLIWEQPTGLEQRHFLSTHLSLHVHDDHCVWSVANHKVLWVFRKQYHTVDSDVCPCSAAQGFKGIWTFCGLHVPDLQHKNIRHKHLGGGGGRLTISNVLQLKIILLKKKKIDSEKKASYSPNT